MRRLYPILEGQTEDAVVQILQLCTVEKVRTERGKDRLTARLIQEVGPLLDEGPLGVLVVRDVDQNESPEQLKIAFENSLKRTFLGRSTTANANLSPLAEHPNVWVTASDDGHFRFALHLAAHRAIQTGTQRTMDDYILALAHEPTVGASLLESNARPEWRISVPDFLRLQTHQLPELLSDAGRPLQEAKEHCAFYSASLRKYLAPHIFARTILSHALEHCPAHVTGVFASLYAAVAYLKA